MKRIAQPFKLNFASQNLGFTLVEIMIVVSIIALLAAIAIPNVLRGRTSANEAAAIGNLRALVSSLEMYKSVNNYYPDTTAGWQTAMYGANCTAGTAPDPDYGPPSFCVALDGGAASQIQGYTYTYTGGAASNATTYTITANPVTLGRTGTRAFFVNESGTIRHCSAASGATAASNSIDQAPNSSCP